MNNIELINKLNIEKKLERSGWIQLFETADDADRTHAGEVARHVATERFGNNIYMRGLIEISNICKNDCLYCGIRKSCRVSRYRMSREEILACCEDGYKAGFRTFVMQGGEDGYFSDDKMVEIVAEIRRKFPDCAITLSLGERSYDSYKRLYDAGANRYLLRHETADKEHYEKLHPEGMSFENRMQCLKNLKQIGFQTGCGMMIGSPYQTPETLASDMLFIRDFMPHMIGIGPFIPAKNTPFENEPPGTLEQTLFVLSLCRIMLPDALLPSTTALGTIHPDGRKMGILCGANVLMPNLSPTENRKNYSLYNDKIGANDNAERSKAVVDAMLAEIGYTSPITRGDYGKQG